MPDNPNAGVLLHIVQWAPCANLSIEHRVFARRNLRARLCATQSFCSGTTASRHQYSRHFGRH